MANFCTNCGTKLGKNDNFCGNCGIKLGKNDNFCGNCGIKLGKNDNFCGNCGTKIDKSYKKQSLLKTIDDIIEKIDAKEKEEEKKKLKTIEEIFESEEIKSEIRKNNIDQVHVISIKDNLKNKLITKRKNMSESEIKYFIKTELKNAKREQEKAILIKEKEMEKNERIHGGYCNYNCKHFYEEYLDSGGTIVGDFDSEGIVDYYCNLNHSVAIGKFCEDYE